MNVLDVIEELEIEDRWDKLPDDVKERFGKVAVTGSMPCYEAIAEGWRLRIEPKTWGYDEDRNPLWDWRIYVASPADIAKEDQQLAAHREAMEQNRRKGIWF